MTSAQIKIAAAMTVLAGLTLFAAQRALAEPMKCSGEEKTCIANCKKAANKASLSACLTSCGTRLSICTKTGCWDNGRQRYCGLAKL